MTKNLLFLLDSSPPTLRAGEESAVTSRNLIDCPRSVQNQHNKIFSVHSTSSLRPSKEHFPTSSQIRLLLQRSGIEPNPGPNNGRNRRRNRDDRNN